MATLSSKPSLKERLQKLRDLNRLVRKIEGLPLELRLMIYRECLPGPDQVRTLRPELLRTIPLLRPLLWLSSSISHEALTHFQKDISFHIHTLRCLDRAQFCRFAVSNVRHWLGMGLGEITALRIAWQNWRTSVLTSSRAPDGSIIVRIEPCLGRSRSGLLNHRFAKHDYTLPVTHMTEHFQRRLTSCLRHSIVERKGYGFALPELRVLSDALWVLLLGFQKSKLPWRVLGLMLDKKPTEHYDEYNKRLNTMRVALTGETLSELDVQRQIAREGRESAWWPRSRLAAF
ncbi:hypothetical protein ANO11243_089280 [Dothideomycetidae sp. 11243]|nr:hypothetical protein ANO11243_089280 [fungal sp. No.11243]